MIRTLPGTFRRVPGLLVVVGGTLVLVSVVPGALAKKGAAGPAPWGAAKLPAERAALTLAEWKKADNRASCAPLAFPNEAVDKSAKQRRANFSGGWAVAYDLPGVRSAFGVAGTGIGPSGGPGWPNNMRWEDGSRVGYGPEGGTGPNYLAYLTVSGQSCLYNVWSAAGKEHLERLLAQLRFVETGTVQPAAVEPTSLPNRVEIVPHSANDATDPTGDVFVLLRDGSSVRLTKGVHATDPKLGPNGLVGWTWAKEKYKGSWVNSRLRVQLGGKVLVDAETAMPFVEEWGFAAQGVVAKSRARRGPAKVELFSLEDGHLIGAIDAFVDDLPSWAVPYKE